MLILAAFLSTIFFVVSAQDASRSDKPLLHKDKAGSDRRSSENPIPIDSLPMGAGTYQYYDPKGVLHIANYVNDMYGFRILSEYTPFVPLNTFSEAEKTKKASSKAKPRNKFNIETFDMFDEIEEKAPEPKKQDSDVPEENTTTGPKQAEHYLSEASTISETVQEKKEFRGRMPSGTFKWPSYPTVMDMGGSKAMDSKYFFGPRIFFNDNQPFPATSQVSDDGNSDTASTPEPPKDTTAAPDLATTVKAEETPASGAPSVSDSRQFTTGYFSINHSPAWAGRPAYPAHSTTGYSIRYGTRNVQPFVPSLTNLNKLWPEFPQLGQTASFGKIVQWRRK